MGGNRAGWGAIAVLASAILLGMAGVAAEKGDTYTSEITAKTLPPGGPYVPAKNKGTAFLTMSDGGIKNKNTVFTWTADTFGLGTLQWQKIVLVSTLLPGTPEILTLASSFQPDFPNGNFTLNEVPNAMAAAGLTMQNLGDNSTFAVMVVNASAGTALGGPLVGNYFSVYGNGNLTEAESAVDDAELSDVVFVADMNNQTLSFDQGYESGLTPTNGTGNVLLQQMPDGGFLWSMEMAIMRTPSKLELRYFKSLEEQPVVLDLTPGATPRMPRVIPAKAFSSSFEGNITLAQLQAGVAAIGLDWNTVNFNTTPPVFLTTLSDAKNGSILGFIFNAKDAPTPPPVIKGSASKAGALLALTIVCLSALIV